jgi:sigma-E factor negative regulatory protein RseC
MADLQADGVEENRSSGQGGYHRQTGRVLALKGDYALIQAEGGGCGRCQEPGGCGGQSLVQMFCRTPRQYRVKNTCAAQPGDRVVVVLPEGVLSRHATLGYGLPLAGLLLGALVGDMVSGRAGNGGALAGAALGLLLAWGIVYGYARRLTGNSRNEPYILRVESQGG